MTDPKPTAGPDVLRQLSRPSPALESRDASNAVVAVVQFYARSLAQAQDEVARLSGELARACLERDAARQRAKELEAGGTIAT